MKNIHKLRYLLVIFVVVLLPSGNFAQQTSRVTELKPGISALENPITVKFLKKNLRNSGPLLVLTPKLEKTLKNKLKVDPVVGNMYQAIRLNVEAIRNEPILERTLTGRRLLDVSREMLYRMNMLGMAYRMERDSEVLNRINDELLAVCCFSDWNPSHFLDVAEMAMAVSIAVDWAGEDLPPATVMIAKTALIEKGIKPSFQSVEGSPEWINGTNNWNQVCHGGMIAAALVTAKIDPNLAALTINRALQGIPHALQEYAPDGVYPEGSTYWSYGTSFTGLTISMLESALGSDFGLGAYSSFLKSADFRLMSIAPSDWYYNFADCGDKRDENGDITLAWFALKTGNEMYFERERFLKAPAEMGKLARHSGAGLVWLSQFKETKREKLPLAWKGEGSNPIVIIRGGDSDPHRYYFGAKGGRGTVNHGNMDAGSFIFELSGIRWSVDPGMQPYHELEATGFDLWGSCQDCDRWTLLTKSNFGHSTLTLDEQLHKADGLATIENFKEGNQPEVTINMTPTLEGQVRSAKRRFVQDSPTSLLIEDRLTLREATKIITWQMMTTAEVEIVQGGAVFKQTGQTLLLENLSHPQIAATVTSLDPPPLELDRQIPNLKRVEIKVPASALQEGKEVLRIRLAGD